jgi:hypothetical protein
VFRLRVWLLWLLVGCGGDGVIVEVETTGLDVASVELVLADRVCQDPLRGGDCASIQGPTFQTGLGQAGDLYTRKASATVRQLDEGLARFELPAADKLLRMAFAIGRDAQGQIVGGAVMARTLDLAAGPIVYRVALDPTRELRDRQPPDTVASAAQWGDRNQCVGIQPLRSTMPEQRPIFILPADDPDCDGRHDTTDGECDPLWFDGVFFDEASATHCAQASTTIPGTPCVIGHRPQCIEADLGDMGCVEAPVRCVPDLVCTSCATDDTACQNDKLGSAATEARLACTFPANDNIGLGLSEACDGNNDSFLIIPAELPSANARCLDAQLAMRSTAAIDSPLEKQFAINGATFTVADVLEDCTIKLKWGGTFPLQGRAVTTLVLTVDVNGQERQLWLPITFEATTTCPSNPGTLVCEYVDDGDPDHIAACAQ